MQCATTKIWSVQFSARRDLRVQANTDRKLAATFNVLDPISRQSYRVGELEYHLLSTLDGNRTLSHVLRLLRRNRQFESIDEHQLLLTIEHLQRSGLVRSSPIATKSSAGHSGTLVRGAARAQGLLSSFVSWQVRGLQPDAWLARLAPHTNAIFSGAAVRFWLLIVMLTCGLVLLEFPRLGIQSSIWQWIVHPVHGSALFAVFLITRGLHELGHAVVCKRHGVRCPDIGLFVVLGAPCVYCDVSESWQLPSRWQRAAVAAAGMYVELIVAAIAAWVWMLTVDGPVNTIALQTMFVCSVSTVVINANPLMRFDGYYLLSDILDESNLRGRADGIAEAKLYRLILGSSALPPIKTQSSMYVHLLCAFSWAGWLYRAGLSLAIAGMLVSIYDSWNLAWVGRSIAVLILISWWGIPSMNLAKSSIQMARKTKTRLRLTLVAALFVVGMSLLPVPYRQFGGGWVQPESMRGVYAAATGLLQNNQNLPASGSLVEEDQPLFSIYDMEAVQNVIRAKGLHERAMAELRGNQQALSKEVEIIKSTAESAKHRWEVAEAELSKSKLTAPCNGRLLIMPATTNRPSSHEADSLKYTWDSETQSGRLIPQGTMLAAICGSQLVAVIPLSDSQLEWIASGVEVRLKCAECADKVYTCKVDKVVSMEDASATWRLMHIDIAESASSSSVTPAGQKSGAAIYAAQIRLPEDVSASFGARIDGVFIAPPQTLGSLCYRWLQQNLRWLAD